MDAVLIFVFSRTFRERPITRCCIHLLWGRWVVSWSWRWLTYFIIFVSFPISKSIGSIHIFIYFFLFSFVFHLSDMINWTWWSLMDSKLISIPKWKPRFLINKAWNLQGYNMWAFLYVISVLILNWLDIFLFCFFILILPLGIIYLIGSNLVGPRCRYKLLTIIKTACILYFRF